MQTKQRDCLKCGKLFDSTWAGHRICKRCTQINARIQITKWQLQNQRGVKRCNGEVISEDESSN